MIANYLEIVQREFKGYNLSKLLKDLLAGLTVASIALPLSLSFGISNVKDASAGLITAIVGGILVCALSGAYYQISGPSGVMGVILVSVLSRFGINGVFLVTMMSGIFLILAGIFKLGKIIYFVPMPVVIGFTSGVAVSRVVGQINLFFGVKSEGLSQIEKLFSYYELGFHPELKTLLIGVLTVVIIIFIPKLFSDVVPSYLLAIILTTIVAFVFSLDVEFLGTLPENILPNNRFNFSLLKNTNLNMLSELFMPAISITFLALIESLLCGASATRMTGITLDSNQEILSHGIGYMVLPFFGGMPTSSIIVRSSLAIKSGAQTRLTGIFQGIFLLVAIIFLKPFISKIPLAALAAVMIVTAFRMNDWTTIKYMIDHKFYGGMIQFFATIILTLIFDLSVAVIIGIGVEIIFFIIKSSEVSISIENIDSNKEDKNFIDGFIVHVVGNLFFMNRDIINSKLQLTEKKNIIIISLRAVPVADISSVRMIMDYYKYVKGKGKKVLFTSVSPNVIRLFEKAGLVELAGKESFYVSSEKAIEDLKNKKEMEAL